VAQSFPGKKRAADRGSAGRSHEEGSPAGGKKRPAAVATVRVDCRPLNPAQLVTQDKLNAYFRDPSDKANARRQVHEAVWE
jgi:hypothetical protein